MDTGQSDSALTPGGQPLIWMITIDIMPFRVLINSDAKVRLMNLQVMLPIVLEATYDYQTFMVNFFIVDPMLPYRSILTLEEHQTEVVPSPPC
jgi:hypothetical protein